MEKIASEIKSTQAEVQQIQADALLTEFDKRRFNHAEQPLRTPPLYLLDGTPFATRENISVITALPGSGKTGLVGALAAAAMVEDGTGCDTMGITANNPASQGVIILDTEMAKEDFWDATHRALRRAGLKQTPYFVRPFYLRGVPRDKILEWLPLYLKRVSDECDGIHSVITDGYSELIADLNDQQKCIAAVAQFMQWAEDHSCHFTGVLHLNPNGEKSRGHFGSEISRRCETEFMLKRKLAPDGTMSGPTTIVQKKSRKAWISGSPTFDWDTDKQMHVRVTPPTVVSRGAKALKKDIEDAIAVFTGHPSMKRGDIVKALAERRNVKPTTAENTLGTWQARGVIASAGIAGLWELGPEAKSEGLNTQPPDPSPES